MKTQLPTAAHTPDSGDILTDSLADAGYWKGEARKAQAENAALRAALVSAGKWFIHYRACSIALPCGPVYSEISNALAKP